MSLCFGLLLLFMGPQEGPRDPSTVPATKYDLKRPLPLDKSVSMGRLENGLTYFVKENAKPEQRLELRLVVNAGSLQEDKDQQGLAHFLEHMAFNGTKNFEKQALVDYIESIGMQFGPDLNAGTSFDETVYMLQVPTDDEAILTKAFLILSDWAQHISLEPEEVEKERGVVLEEWRRGLGAQSRLRDKQFPIIFKDSRYAERLPIGKKEIIETAPAEALQRFYQDWYRPDLMAVVAVGDYDRDKLEAMIRKYFKDMPAAENPRKRPEGSVPDHEETLFAMAQDPEVTMSMIQLMDKRDAEKTTTVGDLRQRLVEALGQTVLNQRLRELTREADPPFLMAYAGRAGMVRAKDAFIVNAAVREGQYDRGLAAVLREMERIEQHGLTATELGRAKTEFMRGAEQSYLEAGKTPSARMAAAYVNAFLGEERFYSAKQRLGLYKQLLPTITLEEVNAASQNLIDPGNQVVVVTAPEKEGLALPKESMLADVIEKVKQSELKAYQDDVGDEPLLDKTPQAGEIVAETVREDIGLTEWTLANGARVLFKSTDFKNDEIRMQAFSDGGTSLVDIEDAIPAASATLLINESGLGDFDATQLEKKLAGKVLRVGPYIGELSEGMQGSTSPQDLETFFKLLYLNFTAPRLDDKAVQSIKTRWQSMIENRLSSPDQVFSDAITKRKYNNHPRRRPLTEADLEKLDPARSLAIYQNRFKGVGDFTFVFVGNIDVETFKPLVETYIGGLPQGRKQESWRDLGINPIDGTNKMVVYKGLEPKTTVYMNFYGTAEWTNENRYALRSLNAALRIRLREILREDMGGVYGVNLFGGLDREPKETFSNTIRFTCDPEKADALIEAAHGELAKIKAKGIDDTVLQKVKETQQRAFEVGLKQNGFWLSNIAFIYANGLDPARILTYPERIEALSSEMIQNAAKRYYAMDNYLQALLQPEDAKPNQ